MTVRWLSEVLYVPWAILLALCGKEQGPPGLAASLSPARRR
jgi:hypothetical protein